MKDGTMPTMRCFSCSLICSAALSCWLCCGVGSGEEACGLELLCEGLLCEAPVVELSGVGADPAAGCCVLCVCPGWGSTAAASSICGVGASGIADGGTEAVAGAVGLASCASRQHDKPRKATPKTSRTAAPTKPECIHSPLLRVGASAGANCRKGKSVRGIHRSDRSLLPQRPLLAQHPCLPKR